MEYRHFNDDAAIKTQLLCNEHKLVATLTDQGRKSTEHLLELPGHREMGDAGAARSCSTLPQPMRLLTALSTKSWEEEEVRTGRD